MNTHILKNNVKEKVHNLKESYGPFKDYDTYKRALAKWSNSAKDKNDEHREEFETNITDAVNDVLTDYYMRGCRYSADDIVKALQYYINDPAPFSFADLIENEDDFEEHDYYEENGEMKESYGPYNSKDEYDNDLRDYKAAAEEANNQHAHDFSYDLLCLFENNFFDKDFPEKISELYFYYESKFGCRYDREEIERYIQSGKDLIKMGERNIKELEKFFESPDPWEFKDMVNNSQIDENSKLKNKEILKEASAVEKRLREREQYYKDMKEIFHK